MPENPAREEKILGGSELGAFQFRGGQVGEEGYGEEKAMRGQEKKGCRLEAAARGEEVLGEGLEKSKGHGFVLGTSVSVGR